MRVTAATESDLAFDRFNSIRQSLADFSEEPSWTESDTRSKLIDPVLIEVLGWSEIDIRREQQAGCDYADYVLGGDHAWLHVEAKRTSPRFILDSQKSSPRLKLSGPHLLGNKRNKPHLEQAAKYSAELGTRFALLTNGTQYILFQSFSPGRPWRSGTAFVFHSLDDIQGRFAEFYELLSKSSVLSGFLDEAFSVANTETTQLYKPATSLPNPNAEEVRNPFWPQVSQIVGPLLDANPQDRDAELDVIKNCYVRTGASDHADAVLDGLLRDEPSPALESAKVRVLQPGASSDAFSNVIERDIEERRARTYILTGGVGCGKTTYLRRFALVQNRAFVEKYCVWLHIDFLSYGNIDGVGELGDDIQEYTYRSVRAGIAEGYPHVMPADGAAWRKVFRAELQQLAATRLYGIEEGSSEYMRIENERVAELVADDQATVSGVLRYAKSIGLRVVIVLDNTDQLGEAFQEAVFLFSQKLSVETQAITVVALREEKFFAAYRRGVFDAFGDRRYHIGSPDVKAVVRKRLGFAIQRYMDLADAEEAEKRTIVAMLRALSESVTSKNNNIARCLACISNGDMRYALAMFRDFVRSGNTDVLKIQEIVEREGRYIVPFHEFAKSAMLHDRRYYRDDVSRVMNVFSRTAATTSSHFTALRLLRRLSAASSASSQFGRGFVDTELVLREYRVSFGLVEDLKLSFRDLADRQLVETEPPRQNRLEETDAVRVSAAGQYYWEYLVRSFAYLDLVFVDTAIASRETARSLTKLAKSKSFADRFDRVLSFLDYLRDVERVELQSYGGARAPYSKPLLDEIKEQILREIEVIRKRVGC